MSAGVANDGSLRSASWLYRSGPATTLVLTVLSLSVLPVAGTYLVDGAARSGALTDLDGGALLPFTLIATSSLGFALMGWASSATPARGACLRAGTQTLSFVVAALLCALPLFMVFGSLDLAEIVERQDATLTLAHLASSVGFDPASHPITLIGVPSWGILFNPVAVALLTLCLLGATRLPPFDGPGARAEELTGLHVEGSKLRTGNAVLTDWMSEIVVAGYIVTVGFGGWAIPFLDEARILGTLVPGVGEGLGTMICVAAHVSAFIIKLIAVVWVIRRVGRVVAPLSFNRLITLCFKLVIPLALINSVVTALVLTALTGPI